MLGDAPDEWSWFAIEDPADTLIASWEDGSVVYSVATGAFTAINVVATEMLHSLRTAGRASVDVLSHRLLGGAPSPDESTRLVEILEQLAELGLVSREVV